jgi:hypothetical protein
VLRCLVRENNGERVGSKERRPGGEVDIKEWK